MHSHTLQLLLVPSPTQSAQRSLPTSSLAPSIGVESANAFIRLRHTLNVKSQLSWLAGIFKDHNVYEIYCTLKMKSVF